MEILITLIALLLILSFLIKGSFLPRWGVVAVSLLLAVAVRLVIPWLAGQPAATVNGWISAPDRMLDGAVCVVLEVVLMMTFCFAWPARSSVSLTPLLWFSSRSLKNARGSENHPLLRSLLYYPGVLAFPAVCWAWSQLLFSRPGIDFTRFAWLAAFCTLFVALGGSWVVRRFLPEEDVRLEGLFLVNLFLLLLTVAATGAITF